MPIMPRLRACDAGERADPEQRHRDGDLAALDELAELAHRVAEDEAVTGEDDRALGRVDHRDRLAEECVLRRWPGRPCGRGAAASQSNVVDDCCASLVMSTSTGPGRPERAR
jgi:hypothetical protein